VPELSRFFEVSIRICAEVGGSHHRPQFHAYYQDDAAVFAIDTLESASAATCRLPNGG
jgi:hypothetical protein